MPLIFMPCVSFSVIDTIILDLDGPILDGRRRHYQCYSDILVEQGFAPLPIDQYWEMKRNKKDRRLQLAASGAEGIYDLFLNSWIERIEQERYLAFDRLQPGVIQKLRKWKREAIRLALVTMRNNPATLHRQLESLGLLLLFDKVASVTTSGETARDKAEAARSFVAVEKKVSTLWIGDTEVDIHAARILGVKVGVVSCGLRTVGYLATLDPDFIVFDLNAVTLSEKRPL